MAIVRVDRQTSTLVRQKLGKREKERGKEKRLEGSPNSSRIQIVFAVKLLQSQAPLKKGKEGGSQLDPTLFIYTGGGKKCPAG